MDFSYDISAYSDRGARRDAYITISSLPFHITAPGTYVLSGNLACPVADVSAITISSGAVMLDLKGWTISNITPVSNAGSVGINIQSNPTTDNISIRNGAITGFFAGIKVACPSGSTNTFVSAIHVERITFISNTFSSGVGVLFQNVNSSSVSNCTFTLGASGIIDQISQGGNSFSNNSFKCTAPLTIHDPAGFTGDPLTSPPFILEDCHSEAIGN